MRTFVRDTEKGGVKDFQLRGLEDGLEHVVWKER